MSATDSPVDARYLEQRAEAELDAAQAATHPQAVRAHFLLATRYLDRLSDLELDPEGPVER